MLTALDLKSIFLGNILIVVTNIPFFMYNLFSLVRCNFYSTNVMGNPVLTHVRENMLTNLCLHPCITQTCPCNILQYFMYVKVNNCDVFLIFALNLDCGYTLEPPQ